MLCRLSPSLSLPPPPCHLRDSVAFLYFTKNGAARTFCHSCLNPRCSAMALSHPWWHACWRWWLEGRTADKTSLPDYEDVTKSQILSWLHRKPTANAPSSRNFCCCDRTPWPIAAISREDCFKADLVISGTLALTLFLALIPRCSLSHKCRLGDTGLSVGTMFPTIHWSLHCVQFCFGTVTI